MLKKFIKFAAGQENGFFSYEWSDRVILRGKQAFAVFGDIAYDVSKQKFTLEDQLPGAGKICVPVKGRYLAEFPDEGQSGIMGMYIITRKGKNISTGPSFVPCGWLYTKELQLKNDEIQQNIADDIEAGENVYYPKPAGWL